MANLRVTGQAGRAGRRPLPTGLPVRDSTTQVAPGFCPEGGRGAWWARPGLGSPSSDGGLLWGGAKGSWLGAEGLV